MWEAAVAGYLISISLIAAIGAQNAFVLRQGLRPQAQHALRVARVGAQGLQALAEVFDAHGGSSLALSARTGRTTRARSRR